MQAAMPTTRRSEPPTQDRNTQARRKQEAFLAGDHARDEGTISPEAHMLYEYLLRYASCRAFCWPGQARLAEVIKCSVSTVKRRTRELIDAGLIRRERRLNRSSLTFITAYCPDMIDCEAEPEADTGSDAVHLDPDAQAVAGPDRTAHEPGAVTDSPFFGLPSGPAVGSIVSQRTFNSQNQEDQGGGKHPCIDLLAVNETTETLQRAGVLDQHVLHELRDCPVEQVERTVRYAAKCRTSDDPRRPGLIVYMLRRKSHLQPSIVRSPHRKQRGRQEHRDGSVPALAETRQEAASDPTLATTWQAVLVHLAQEMPADTFTTWLRPTSLLAIIDREVAVVATPNVIVRNELEGFREQIAVALTAQLGHDVGIELTIDSSARW